MRFDFVGRKKIWFTISFVLILAGIGGILARGLNFGIEFKGGTLFDLRLKKPARVAEVRKVLKRYNLEKSIIQPLGKKEVLIRTRSLTKDEQKEVLESVDKEFGISERRYIQSVGPGWGSHITRAALIALALSIGALLIYISLRFEFKMAVTAIGAVVHDIVITVGIYALTAREITPNTVAAFLTILGYSLYDTIVVFHRILENTPKITKSTYSDMVNASINQVFIRSLNTSLTTLLPILSLLFLGGETLKDFAFALMVGVITGTYSSPFFASPILSLWKEMEPRYRALRKKYGKIR